MYNNNVYGPMMGQPMYGNYYQGPTYPGEVGKFVSGPANPLQMAKNKSSLSKEQYEILQKGNTSLWSVTEEEVAHDACNHFNPKDGTFMCTPVGNGKVRCSICGEEFSVVQLEDEDVKKAVDVILNITNTIKAIYVGQPVEMISYLYNCLPIIRKLPKIYSVASKSFSKLEESINNTININTQPQNMGLLHPHGGGGYYNPYYQQPMGMGCMMPQQQPMPVGGMAPMMGAGVQSSPFVQGGIVPDNNGGYFNNNMVMPNMPVVQQPQVGGTQTIMGQQPPMTTPPTMTAPSANGGNTIPTPPTYTPSTPAAK